MNFKQRIISDILKLVSIKSFTGDREGIIDCQTAVCEMATDMGFLCSYHGDVLVIEPRNKEDDPELGIVVHLDTVPYDEKEWTANPLGEIKEGRIFGRGVIDDKAAIVLAMYAMLEKAKEIEPSWQIIVGSSEEGKFKRSESAALYRSAGAESAEIEGSDRRRGRGIKGKFRKRNFRIYANQFRRNDSANKRRV